MTLLKQLHSVLSPESSLDEFYTSSIPLFKTHRILACASEEVAASNELKPETREQAQSALHESKAKHSIYRDALDAVIHMFNKSGIEYILLKGASIWPYYPAVYLREQDDIDILVRKKDLAPVIDLIKNQWKTAETETGPFHIACRLETNSFPDLEIHTQTGPRGLNRIDPDVLFSHTDTVTTDGLDIQTLSFPFLIQHISFHAANHRILSRIQWLNDINLLLESCNDISFLSKLKGMKKRSCAAVIHYAHNIFESPHLETAEKMAAASPLFIHMLSKVIPSDNLLNNPVLHSGFRTLFYHLLLIQNPLSIAKAAFFKICGRH